MALKDLAEVGVPAGFSRAIFAVCSPCPSFRTFRPFYRVKSGTGDSMPEIVTTPISFFEALIEYERPNVLLWLERGSVVQALFDAFAKWNVRVDDVDILTAASPLNRALSSDCRKSGFRFFLAQLHARSLAIAPVGKLCRKRSRFWMRL
jgi:hypothetical protein